MFPLWVGAWAGGWVGPAGSSFISFSVFFPLGLIRFMPLYNYRDFELYHYYSINYASVITILT
jgi:hypothetical protein